MDTIILLICSNLLWLTFLLTIRGFESHSLGPFNVIVKRIIIIIVVNVYIYIKFYIWYRFTELR